LRFFVERIGWVIQGLEQINFHKRERGGGEGDLPFKPQKRPTKKNPKNYLKKPKTPKERHHPLLTLPFFLLPRILVEITQFSILQANKVQTNKQNKQTNKEYCIQSLKILIFWGVLFSFLPKKK
jgi:hypothetical protein